MTNTYNIKKIRKDFPILDRKIYGNHLTYLDNAASSQKPKIVLDTIQKSFGYEYANVHRGLHYLSNISTQKFENARTIVKKFLNAKSSNEIIFTKNATEAINLVASSLSQSNSLKSMQLNKNDEIILSIMEHHSNIIPWHFLRERNGIILKWANINNKGDFLLEEYEKLFTKKTKFVAITHMSNVIGSITPIKKIIEIAHSYNAKVLIDGSQSAVHMNIDVIDLDVDFFVFTGHKIYGPSGIGVLYGKEILLNSLSPFLGGGEMVDIVTKNKITYMKTPHRFEAGTPPIVEAIGLGAALEYIMNIGRNNIQIHEDKLLNLVTKELKKDCDIEIIGKTNNKKSLLSFNVADIHPHDISTILDREGVAIRAGTHCAQPILNFFNKVATCRISFAMYNNENDINRFIMAIKKAKSFFM